MMFWFVHSKSKASPIASRMRRSLNISRRVLKYQPCVGTAPARSMTSRLTRPSRKAGKS